MVAGQLAVVRALEENLWALWSRFGRGEGCSLHEENHALWFDTPLPCLPYNAVLRFAAEDHAADRMDALFAHYRRRGVPFLWIVHPSAQPLDLDVRLRAHGFEEAEICPGMYLDLGRLLPPEAAPAGIEIREAAGGADVNEILDLIAWRWRIEPHWRRMLRGVTKGFDVGASGSSVRCWLAWRGQKPVAKAVLNLAAGVAGVYGVATRPEARGLGLARLLTLLALQEARRQGYDLAVLHATPAARSLYEKIGFRDAAPFRIFAPPGGLHV